VLSLSELVAGDIHGSISQSLVTYGQLHVTALTGLSQVLSDVQYSVEEHGMDIAAESSAPISSFSNAGQIASTKLRRTLETISSAFVDILSDVCGNSFDTGGGAIMNEYIQAAAVDEFKVSLNVSSTMDLVHGFFQLSIHSPESQVVVISLGNTLDDAIWGRCPPFARPLVQAEQLITRIISRESVSTRKLTDISTTCTAMYMTGFVWVDNQAPCLLFEAWSLDSALKFSFGAIGVFLFGISVEGVVTLKRMVRSSRFSNDQRANAILYLCVYSSQVVFGYFAMLIAMTYSVPLFLSLVLGLSAGHCFFNWRKIIDGKQKECCSNQGKAVEIDASRTTEVLIENCGTTRACCAYSDSESENSDPITILNE